MVQAITPEMLYHHLQKGDALTIVDSRYGEDFEAWHLDGAINVPYKPAADEIDATLLESIPADAAHLVCICAKGRASNAVAEAAEDRIDGKVSVVQDGMEGWSRVYDVIAVPTAAPGVELYQFQRIAKGCLSYLVCDVESHEAVAVDPTRHIEEFQMVAEDDEMSITHVVDTHLHADHISGGRELANVTGASYHLPEASGDRDVSFSYDPLGHTAVIDLDGISLKAIHTPGHTTDSTSLLVNAEALLTGDTVFVDSVGRTELEFGEKDAKRGARELFRSISRSILTLPDAVTVLPGHQRVPDAAAMMVGAGTGIQTTVGSLRRELPLLAETEDDFVERLLTDDTEKPPNFDRVIEINAGRDDPDGDAEATTLELGPNRCAAAAD